jgi:hypothetical protein
MIWRLVGAIETETGRAASQNPASIVNGLPGAGNGPTFSSRPSSAVPGTPPRASGLSKVTV